MSKRSAVVANIEVERSDKRLKDTAENDTFEKNKRVLTRLEAPLAYRKPGEALEHRTLHRKMPSRQVGHTLFVSVECNFSVEKHEHSKRCIESR